VRSRLQGQLDAVFGPIHRKRVAVAYVESGKRLYAGASSDREDEAGPAEWTFATGCITKLFTGALLEREVRAGILRRQDLVAPFLAPADGKGQLAGVTPMQLMEHTHGLDHPAVTHAPLQTDGTVDVAALLDGLERFAPPATVYSYSNVGAWIMAAMLERLNGLPFAEQLSHNLFGPIGIDMHQLIPSQAPEYRGWLCPSMGARLALSVRDLVTFLEHEALLRPRSWPSPGERSEITGLPGWNALERGIYRGWKYHGGDWFGHNSVWPDASAMVRVEPHRGIALVIASRDHPAQIVAAKLFGRVLPEYTHLRFPRALSADVAAQLELGDYCGTYRTAAETITIEQRDLTTLQLIAAGVKHVLAPAENDVFFTRPAMPGGAVFVQFLQREDERFRYLWNGRCIFRVRTPIRDRSRRYFRRL
jgi:CubicO group peptidase (beta-lactamase class C family)